jgi:hypothetical protein
VILRMISKVRGVGAGPSALSSSANTAACESAIVLAYPTKNPVLTRYSGLLCYKQLAKDFLMASVTG